MKIGLIDVGGGMRGAYGAGVLDRCIDDGVRFDHCEGVSAGSANVVSYLAGQKGRNYRYYTEYSFRPEYMSMGNLLRRGNYIDLEYIYSTLSNQGGEDPLDFAAAAANPAEFKVVATDAKTGKPHYFDISDMAQNDYGAIKASCCVPVVNRPYYVKGIPYFDGGVSDPIPLEHCFDAGCDRVVVILTRPRDFRRVPSKDKYIAALMAPRFPHAAAAMRKRSKVYNLQLDMAEDYEKQGKVLIVAPDDIGDLKTLTREREVIKDLYVKGYKDGAAIRDQVLAWREGK